MREGEKLDGRNTNGNREAPPRRRQELNVEPRSLARHSAGCRASARAIGINLTIETHGSPITSHDSPPFVTRNSHSSKTPSISLKTNASDPSYPERPGATPHRAQYARRANSGWFDIPVLQSLTNAFCSPNLVGRCQQKMPSSRLRVLADPAFRRSHARI